MFLWQNINLEVRNSSEFMEKSDNGFQWEFSHPLQLNLSMGILFMDRFYAQNVDC